MDSNESDFIQKPMQEQPCVKARGGERGLKKCHRSYKIANDHQVLFHPGIKR